MVTKKGFTLIELLVVIAIIALLLSIIVPSLKVAKDVATAAACLSNQKSLSTAWNLYQEGNGGFLVGGSTYYGNNGTPYRWCERPLYKDTDNPEINAVPATSEFCLAYRLNGIRAGKLYPYIESEKAYRCPNDKNYVTQQEPYAVYRTYAISGLMNSEDFLARQGNIYTPIIDYRTLNFPGGGTKKLMVATRMANIKSPGTKYVFVEEDVVSTRSNDGKQDYNKGGFVLMDGVPTASYWMWWDTPAYWHNDQSTFGFADGHAEKHRWGDSRTVELMKNPDTAIVGRNQPNNPDLDWLNRGYMPQ